MSEQNAAASMKGMVDTLTRPHAAGVATAADTPDRMNLSETALQVAAEYWAKRIMWSLVAVTTLWDIAETFDKHLAAFSKVLPHP
jgi:hypothetical protein